MFSHLPMSIKITWSEMCGIFSLLYELYIKSKLHVHSVISHCVSCKHVIRKKINNYQSSMSVVLPLVWYTCRFVSPFRRHTLIHMYTQPHTHAHATNICMYIHTHNITCTHTTPCECRMDPVLSILQARSSRGMTRQWKFSFRLGLR